ncbi:MAG TPA: S8 family serine peptidase [Solirubrobacteraceae bacterium]
MLSIVGIGAPGLAAPVASAAARAGLAASFPRGSLALGHSVLFREDVAAAGIVSSRVPVASRVAADELLVTFAPGAQDRMQHRISSQRDVSVVGALPDLPAELVRFGTGDRMRALAWLRAQRGVESVQPNVIEYPDQAACAPAADCTVPNDPGFPYQWYLENVMGDPLPSSAGAPIYGSDVDAPRAWARTRGSRDVRIAVVDTGIDAGHPDLAGKVVAAANFTASTTALDLSGHGTHVAGVAAANFDNGIGIAGMAPNARLMDIKVLAVDGDGRTAGDCADVADGIVWATNHGANVINMSLGSRSPCQAIALAVDYAYAHGALPIAAAGNDASTVQSYPAADNHVLSVAATTASDQVASFSNRGASWVDVAAPGAGIVSTLPTYANGTGAIDYGYLSGTSMATPVVSGIAGLIWAQMPAGQANRDVEARILTSAEPVAGTGTDWRYGLVDACRAVTANAPACAPLPSPPPGTPTPSPPPSQVAQPAPVAPPPSRPNAAPGLYTASLGRRGGPLRLTVADGGNALVRIQATVLMRCPKGPSRRVNIAALSTTNYGKIMRHGKIALLLQKGAIKLRRQQIRLSGTFNVTGRRARGTLRITGLIGASGRCDSRPITWTARRTLRGQ